jgi:ABC-type transport system involved in multi-copper enzyme maturation permease subunit
VILFLIADIVYPIIGWVGTIAYLLGYFLLTTNKLKSNQVSYHVLNIIGSIGLTANAVYYTDLPNIVVNLVWGIIALGAIIMLLRKRSG